MEEVGAVADPGGGRYGERPGQPDQRRGAVAAQAGELRPGRLNLIVEQIRALDAEGRLINGRTAALGRGAATDAPPSQHGHTRPASGKAPASHDFR